MLETPHVALGVAIAIKSGNPWVAIPLSFASHFILDRIPHWNPHFYTETKKNGHPSKLSTIIASIDEFVAISFTLYMAYLYLPNINESLLILICSFMSVLSDQIKIPFFFFNQKQGLLKKWVDFERSIQVEVGPVWGIINQILIIFSSVYWIAN